MKTWQVYAKSCCVSMQFQRGLNSWLLQPLVTIAAMKTKAREGLTNRHCQQHQLDARLNRCSPPQVMAHRHEHGNSMNNTLEAEGAIRHPSRQSLQESRSSFDNEAQAEAEVLITTPATVVEQSTLMAEARSKVSSGAMMAEVVTEGCAQRTTMSLCLAAAVLLMIAVGVVVAVITHVNSPTTVLEAFTTTEELYQAIDEYISERASSFPNETTVALRYGYPIGVWDVSKITDFSRCFDRGRETSVMVERYYDFEPYVNHCLFNDDISQWDVSNAETMMGMFAHCDSFNQDLSGWNVSRNRDFSYMFVEATRFNGAIAEWDTSSGQNFEHMFDGASSFDGNLSRWNVGLATNMNYMFHSSGFAGSVSSWNTSSLKSMQGRNKWNVSSVNSFQYMFERNTDFNANLSNWDTSSATSMVNMLGYTEAFLGTGLEHWKVGSVRDFSWMFRESRQFANEGISVWNVSSAEDMDQMFSRSIFTGNLCAWGDTLPSTAVQKECLLIQIVHSSKTRCYR